MIRISDETEELGINWSKSFAGPSVAYANSWRQRSGTSTSFSANSTQETFDNIVSITLLSYCKLSTVPTHIKLQIKNFDWN